jgi:hypothetical protein
MTGHQNQVGQGITFESMKFFRHKTSQMKKTLKLALILFFCLGTFSQCEFFRHIIDPEHHERDKDHHGKDHHDSKPKDDKSGEKHRN